MIHQYPAPHGPYDGSAEEAPIVKLWYGLLADCIKRGSERIHVLPLDQSEDPEPYRFLDQNELRDEGDPELDRTFCIRAFVNGAWEDITKPPLKLYRAFLQRLKVMAGFSLATRNPIEEGRFRFVIRGSVYDIRVTVRVGSDGSEEAMVDLPSGPTATAKL